MFLSSTFSHRTSPQGSVLSGRNAVMFLAAGLKRSGLTRLLTKGAFSLSARPSLHAAEAIAVKSPASIWAVGTYEISLVGIRRTKVPW